jgi:hypothetical protein
MVSRLLNALLIGVWLAGCGIIPERNPDPGGDGQLAEIAGLPTSVRFWGDEAPARFVEAIRERSKDELQRLVPELIGTQHHYLAVSGGGQNGAFGAGLLVGWSAAGTRPEFTMVTGISTGALTAPFAFLGEAYDDELTQVYTTYSTNDLISPRPWTAIATGDASADTDGLRRVIRSFVDPKLLEDLASAYRQGRHLYIGTTHLDARRPVIWDVTAIAAHGGLGARDLVVDVLLASASIPAVFPPVIFPVVRDGTSYDELHVDGGAAQQVFLYPAVVDWPALLDKLDAAGRPQVYVIRNSRLEPEWAAVTPDVMSIATTSLSSLIRTQGLGDLNRLYLTSTRDGMDFHLAYIPDTFTAQPAETFDPGYMRQLFRLGFKLAEAGYPWAEIPPDLRVDSGP